MQEMPSKLPCGAVQRLVWERDELERRAMRYVVSL